MTDVQTTAPVMPAKLRGTYDVSPQGMCIRYRPRFGAVGFLIVWLMGWTAGCVLLAHQVFVKQEWMTIVFAIPFWSAWLFVFALVVGALTRRQRLEVDALGLRYVDRAVVTLNNRHIPRDEFRKFVVARRKSKSKDNHAKSGLEVRTTGKPLFMFQEMPDAELRWLSYQLSQLIEAQADDESADAGQSRGDALGPRPQTLAMSEQEVEPPSDASWELTRDFQSLRFVERGRWSWSGVLGLLFVNCFWNGIVSVFVGVLWGFMPGQQPQGLEWLMLFLFLIPFEAIGLVLIAALLFALLEPVRRRTWQFEPGLITYRQTWLGVGPRWAYPFEALARIDLGRRRGLLSRFGVHETADEARHSDAPCAMVLVKPDNTELCAIDGLTEGDARWMADVVMREWPEWFR